MPSAAIDITSSRRSSPLEGSGFSLVEVLVASVILFTSVTAAVTLFNFTNINARLGEEKQDEQAAISDDLATIIQINDKFSCTDANNCSSGITYPNENEYIPGDPNGLSAICGPDGTGSGFGPKLVDAINNLALAPRLNELNITRSAKIPAAINTNNTPPHLYSIEWKKDSITLRQITLMPTVASWCP